MDYTEMAKQFLHDSFRFRNCSYQKKIDGTMRGESFVLLYIWGRSGIVLPSEISNEMAISSARVAVILNSLEDKGFITRRIDEGDRRKILVELTKKGVSVAEKHNKMVIGLTKRMLASLGEYDATELVRITSKLAALAAKITNSENCSG